MGLRRSWLRRLERAAREGYDSFELRDGTTYYYDFNDAGMQMFLYACDPDADAEEPEFISRVKRAKDPRAVLERFRAGDMARAFFDPLALLEDIPDEHQD